MQNLAKCFSSILCLLGFLILNSTSISGQDRQAFVDSLIQHLPATKDSIYQRQLGIIGESHPNLDSSYQYIMESLALAKELDNNNSLWNSYMLLGKWYFKQGHKLKAIPFFDTASTIAQQTANPGWLSRTLIIKGDCEVTIGKLDAAQESYSKALDICTANNFVKLNAVLQLRIGEFYRTQEELDKALPFLDMAEHLFDSLQNQQGVCNCKYAKGALLVEKAESKKDYYEIIELFKYATGEKCQVVFQASMLAASHAVLGEYYGLIGKNKEAEIQLKKGVDLAKANRHPAIITYSLGNLAMHYARLKDRKKALAAIEESEKTAKDTDEIQVKNSVQEQKAIMYAELGDTEEAMSTMKGFVKLEIEALKKQNLLALEELNIKYNTLQNEQELTKQKLMLSKQESTFNKILLLVALLGIALLGLLLWYAFRLRNKRLVAQRLAEINQIKTDFFTNISHEFRTPLTLILAPIQKYFNDPNDKQDLLIPKAEVASMIRNAGQLQNLIDQLLDLSSIESQQMALNPHALDLDHVVRQVVNNYNPLAQQKNIHLQLDTPSSPIVGLFDQEKIETIIRNILSNALKFTPSGGSINMALNQSKDQVEITISDNGKGISKEQLSHVFERFYQGDSSITRTHGGSGIGLALAKELAMLHKGNITVKSQINRGTTFTIILPYTKAEIVDQPVKDAIISRRDQLANDLTAAALFIPDSAESDVQEDQGFPQVLIVEDHPDMRRFIKQELQAHYRILEADNGKTAFKLACEHVPDLIISDIMMPGEGNDGLSLTKALKEELLTSHIPVVLLTAKASKEDKITGLEKQADAYLVKPFDPAVLMASVNNLIQQRRKLKILFAESIQIVPEDLPVNTQEEVFMKEVVTLIEQHLSDENFGVEQMSDSLNLDRSQLFRKVKALTGKPPSQLLKEMRLQKAHYLLLSKAGNVSQIAQAVGYRDPFYFSKSFKKEFGVNPTEILKQQESKS